MIASSGLGVVGGRIMHGHNPGVVAVAVAVVKKRRKYQGEPGVTRTYITYSGDGSAPWLLYKPPAHAPWLSDEEKRKKAQKLVDALPRSQRVSLPSWVLAGLAAMAMSPEDMSPSRVFKRAQLIDGALQYLATRKLSN